MQQRVIVILGPTAVGKTKISIELAKRFNSEIISGDSTLVYRGLDIGTAKPSLEEQEGIVHHLVDILAPEQDFSVTKFTELAAEHIACINAAGKIPILAGGTGLYVKALLEGYQFNATPGDGEYRHRLSQLAATHGNAYLHQLLMQVDPATAARLHANDSRRIIRALEVYHLGGEHISQNKTAVQLQPLMYDSVVIGLTMDRQRLYERINQRVDAMMAAGLIAEVEQLLAAGIAPHCQALKAIGYKELIAYLNGQVSLDAAVNQIKQSTRHFAKRQITWYNKMPYIQWFDLDQYTNQSFLLEVIYKEIAGKFCIE